VESAGAAVDELLNELGDIGTGSPLGGEVTDLLLGRNLASQQKPEETLGQRLLTTGSLGKKLLDLGDLDLSVSCLSAFNALFLSLTVRPRKRIPSSESRTEP
jgi:hypothetical protein